MTVFKKGTLALALVGSACASTGPDRPTAWGSAQVSLRVADDSAVVEILSSGGCYGSFGNIDHTIPSGTFVLSGMFTQLRGVFPGRVQHRAEYRGSIAGKTMTLSIVLPELQEAIGPFQLTAGVTKSWSACLFP